MTTTRFLSRIMLENTVLSGVAFTRSLEGRAPYFVVNYAEGGDTASVTGGKDGQQCAVMLRNHGTLPTRRLMPRSSYSGAATTGKSDRIQRS